jgi:hypothetical protein
MPSFTIELTEDQAAIVADMAAGHGLTMQAVIIEAIGHGIAMMVAGVDPVGDAPEELRPVMEEPEPARKTRRKTPSSAINLDDDIPF